MGRTKETLEERGYFDSNDIDDISAMLESQKAGLHRAISTLDGSADRIMAAILPDTLPRPKAPVGPRSAQFPI